MSQNHRWLAMYHRRRAAGLCVRCGHKALKGTSRCSKHTARGNEYMRERRHNQDDEPGTGSASK